MSSRFQSLNRPPRFWMTVGEKQQFVQSNFEDCVRKSALKLYSPTSMATLVDSGGFIVGVFPSFVSADLVFLDLIEAILTEAKEKRSVFVVDMGAIGSEEQLRQIFPEFNFLNQSPIVASWEDGKHDWTCAAEPARARLVEALNPVQKIRSARKKRRG